MSADWQPLERMLGPSLCADFMFIGRAEQIHLYKHRDTRRHLNICSRWDMFSLLNSRLSADRSRGGDPARLPSRITKVSRQNDKGVGIGENNHGKVCQ
jgi:hypothetical protein